MKSIKMITVLALLLIGLPMTAQVNSGDFTKLDKSPLDIAMFRGADKEPMMKVVYSRPAKNGREIAGKLIKFNEVWRTGANESTEITFYKDMMFGDAEIAAGTYTMFTIPGEDEWTIILNKDTDTWGAYGYNKEQDVARITTTPSELDAPLENFTIMFEPKDKGATMYLAWDDFYVPVSLETM